MEKEERVGEGRREGKKKIRRAKKEGDEKKGNEYMRLQLPLGFSFQLKRGENYGESTELPSSPNPLRTQEDADTKSMQNFIFPDQTRSMPIFVEKGGREMRQETKQL